MSNKKGIVAAAPDDTIIGHLLNRGGMTGEQQRGEPDVRRAFVVEGRVLNMDGSPKGNADDQLGQHDVILGRGLGTYNHIGNVEFRKLVHQHKMRYLASSKVDKPKVARELVQIWKQLDPPGRFLQRVEEDNNKLDWVEVCDKKAQEKASQCLRERTPDVLPYYESKRKATKSTDSVVDNNSPTQMKKKMRLDWIESSGFTPEIPGLPISNLHLSSVYTGERPAVIHAAAVPGYSGLTELLLNHEIERKVALRQLLLRQLYNPQVQNQLSLETILGLIPVHSNTLTNPIHFGRWL